MPRLEWGKPEERVFEAGISNVVLYVDGASGIAWNGIVSIEEKREGGEPRSFFYDGEKYKQRFTNEVFEATIEAYTYPEAFQLCEGIKTVRTGFYVEGQKRVPFSLCYRTEVGDGITSRRGYKLHLVYDAWAYDSEKTRETMGESLDAFLFSWEITTVPVQLEGFRPSAHYILDSREISSPTMSLVEGYLYGNDTNPARIPTPDELLGLLNLIPDGITVTNHGDGTFTVSGTDDQVVLVGDGTFVLDSNGVETVGETYTATSS